MKQYTTQYTTQYTDTNGDQQTWTVCDYDEEGALEKAHEEIVKEFNEAAEDLKVVS